MLEILRPLRPLLFHAALFSMVMNLLLLAPALYLLQVFDRVLSTRHVETLALLTIAALVALLVSMALDVLRGWLLASAAVVLYRRIGPVVLQAVVTSKARLRATGSATGLRDVNTIRQFLTAQGILSVFDAPWLPFYLVIIFLFHPLLGAVASVGAAALVGLAILNERTTRHAIAALHEQTRAAGKFIDTAVRNAEAASALGMLDRVVARCSLRGSASASRWRARSTARRGWWCSTSRTRTSTATAKRRCSRRSASCVSRA